MQTITIESTDLIEAIWLQLLSGLETKALENLVWKIRIFEKIILDKMAR